MSAYLTELIGARELLFTWTMRDFKVRYSQSILGAAWAILQPLSLMVVYSVIFSVFIKVPTDEIPYPIFAYTALLPWTFFANSLNFAIPSLVGNMNLVIKIYFPRETLPLSAIIVSSIDFLIGISVLVLLMVVYRIPVGPTAVLVPLIVLIQVILTFGISLAGSAVNAFYRDVHFVIPLALQIWMYLSPIFYSVNVVPERLRPAYLSNYRQEKPKATRRKARQCRLRVPAGNYPCLWHLLGTVHCDSRASPLHQLSHSFGSFLRIVKGTHTNLSPNVAILVGPQI